MVSKRFSLVLHSHLPHVLNHGRWPHGSDWLSEVACETYLPIIDVVETLRDEGITPKITIGLTPVLCEQLASDVFKREFIAFLDTREQAAMADEVEFLSSRYEKYLAPLAVMWKEYYRAARRQFESMDRDIVGVFRRLQDAGLIEVMGSAATHGYLPLLYDDERVRTQVSAGVRAHEKHFGKKPAGFWLPECAYRPAGTWRRPIEGGAKVERKGIEDILAENGIRYFIVDSHLVTHGQALGTYQHLFEGEGRPALPKEKTSGAPTHRAYYVGRGPVACFVRDAACGLQVWSGEHGYPGDPAYLEFHKRKWPGGMRYWKVTSADKDLGSKGPYDQATAKKMTSMQAWHFVGLVKWAIREGGIICAPYDAELFGHWWHEGPEWMKEVFRLISADTDLDAVTLGEDLAKNPPEECIALPYGSWGAGGSDEVWLNSWTQWIWDNLYPLNRRVDMVLDAHEDGSNELLDTIKDATKRQLLLAESSDWPFLITTGQVGDYAERRFKEHVASANALLDMYLKIKGSETLQPYEKAELERLDKEDFPFAGLL